MTYNWAPHNHVSHVEDPVVSVEDPSSDTTCIALLYTQNFCIIDSNFIEIREAEPNK
jgi:hypothetical protein